MKILNFAGLVLVSYFGIFFSEGCQRDTCNNHETFLDLKASLLPNVTTNPNQIGIEIKIVSDANLPASYFQELSKITGNQGHSMDNLDWQNDHTLLDSFETIGTERIHLFLNEAIKDDFSRNYEFHFVLPDRQEFIDCTHNGVGHAYYIDISLKLTEENGLLQIDQFSWEETLSA